MGDDELAIRIAISPAQHKALQLSKPYDETLREWSNYVISEGLHAIEAQRGEER